MLVAAIFALGVSAPRDGLAYPSGSFEVLSYAKDVPGGSADPYDDPFLIEIDLLQPIPPFGTTPTQTGSVRLDFRLHAPTRLEAQGDISRQVAGFASAGGELSLYRVGTSSSLWTFREEGGPTDGCPSGECTLSIDSVSVLEPGDYYLQALGSASGTNVFFAPLGRIFIGSSHALVHVSIRHTVVPEPGTAALVLIGSLLLARRDRRGARARARARPPHG